MKNPLIAALVLTLCAPMMPQAIAAEPAASCTPPAPKKTVKRSKPKASVTPALATTTIAPNGLYQQALSALRGGRVAEAQGLLQQQLHIQPAHQDARILLATLHLESGQQHEAEALLLAGQQQHPANTNLAMTLARLQADRGALPQARATLARSADHATHNGAYLAFMAALAQKDSAHQEAASLLTRALAIQPGTGIWLLAQARSLSALHKDTDARAAYQAALASGQLTAAQKDQARRGLAGLSQN